MYAYPTGGLVEKYIRGEIGIAICRSKNAARDTIQFGFILRMGVFHDSLSIINPTDVNRRWNWFDSEQSLVLPQVIKLADMPENRVPTVISFCSFDVGDFSGGTPIFGFQFLDGCRKIIGRFGVGEIGCAIRYYTVARHDSRYRKIEGCSDGIDDSANITDDERIKRLFTIGDKQFHIGALRVVLRDNLVWATTLPSQEPFLQDWDLGLGPLDWD